MYQRRNNNGKRKIFNIVLEVLARVVRRGGGRLKRKYKHHPSSQTILFGQQSPKNLQIIC